MAVVVKIYDVAAHVGHTLCLRIGPKSGRVMVTGGEDKKINLWAIGKTTPVMSLSGHSTDVTSVTLDWPEEIVVAGSSSGAIKLWDLQHAKVIRTLIGHKKTCTIVEFHPFGEFFASGSADLTVRVWDIRRKGCIQTYQGHTAGISALKITPDGRWIASGGVDGDIKIWDMTAGKLLHSFAESSSSIASMAFSPAELVLAAMSVNGNVACYDLQTFEKISNFQSVSTDATSTGPEEEGRCVEFHPDGALVTVATSHGLQLWNWEEAECYSAIPAQWGRVADLKVLSDENKLVAASIDQNFVHLWGANLTKMNPHTEELNVQDNNVEKLHFSPDRTSSPPVASRPLTTLDSRILPSIDRTSSSDSKVSESISSRWGHLLESPGDSMSDRKPRDSSKDIRIPPPDYREKSDVYTARDDRPVQPSRQIIDDTDKFGSSESDSSGQITHFNYPSLSEVSRKHVRQDWQPLVQQPGTYDLDDDENVIIRNGSSNEISGNHLGSVANVDVRREVVSASGDRPLGLDISKFVQSSGNCDSIAPDSTQLVLSQPSLSEHHVSVTKSLSARLTALRTVRAAWTSAGLRGAMDACAAIQDFSVWVDFLKILCAKPKLLTLESCALFLPVLDELLFAVYEEYVVVACGTIRILARHFGRVIVETLESAQHNTSGIDITREERIEKCKACHRGFLTVVRTLNDLRRSTGQVGRAVRDALRELETLSF
ncbi:hypothetical protein SeMB42_g02414 [Synchytrium endobioticum]|nr:hypothetical protein SeMB42_g02414 [Synchytrium endobioticum]